MMTKQLELEKWQESSLEALRGISFARSCVQDVTVIAYYFRPDNEYNRFFWRTEFAFLKTFQTQGLMPAVLIVNKRNVEVEHFCDKHSISIQVAENLVPGNSRTLAIDLVRNLHERFDTPYVLTIQDDGFPMRPGLEEFVGKWDYIGAPWVRHVTWYDLYPSRYQVGNGGFSLRSKRLCETASGIYRKWFKRLPYWWYMVGDDTFYCKTLRFWFRNAVKDMKWPMLDEAAKFSIEGNYDFMPSQPPLGFHKKGFDKYIEKWGDNK